MGCLSNDEIVEMGGSVVNNINGTISVYIPNNVGINSPVILTKTCCNRLGFIFDIDKQTCNWTTEPCGIESTFKIVLNPKGNDGAIFNVGADENCTLNVKFDYLFKIKCETLSTFLNILPSANTSIGFIEATMNYENQITICENLSTQIVISTKIFNGLNYSISCTQTVNVSGSNEIITNNTKQLRKPSSAFGNVYNITETTPTGVPSGSKNTSNPPLDPVIDPVIDPVFEEKPKETKTTTYCITEQLGLAAWKLILGLDKYNRFLAGDPTSYTCSDFNNLINQDANTNTLVFKCNLAFGEKTTAGNTLNKLIEEQKICNDNLLLLLEEIRKNDIVDNCSKPIDIFEKLDVSVCIDIVNSDNTLTSVFTYNLFPEIGSGNLFNYLSNNLDSGFYVCGDPSPIETSFSSCTVLNTTTASLNTSSCNSVVNNILTDLIVQGNEPDILSPSIFSSQWLNYSTNIVDPDIISLISNEKIKITLKINHTCAEFCILMDNIVLDKVCSVAGNNNIFLTQSPGFELTKLVDNKKSWDGNSSSTNRLFDISNNNGNSSIRQTDYDVNDDRLIINTKEVDLDISIASGIETDVWCFLKDNDCLLTGITNCNICVSGCCGDNLIDFNDLLTQPISGASTIDNFIILLFSELIDVKNRQTLSSYPTIRALYDRYMDSNVYCGVDSSKFDYVTMDQFAGLIDNFWVEIIEQVVPSTSIWGSVKVYSNTIFDQQKFKYKAYTSLFGENNLIGEFLPSPINGTTGACATVGVSVSSVSVTTGGTIYNIVSTYDSICLGQLNTNSEFIGSVTIITK